MPADDHQAAIDRCAADPTAERLCTLGTALLDARRPVEAADAFARATELDPGWAEAWCGLAEAFREQGRWNAAVDAATEATRRDADHPGGWTGLALALLGAQRDGESLAAARRAVECDAASAPAQRALALVLLRHRRLDGAEEAVSAALRAAPSYPEGTAALALVRMVQGRFAEADGLFRQALAARGGMAEAVGNHAALLARLGRDADALEAAAQAVALKPFLPGPHVLRGSLLRRAGRFAEAADAFTQAASADPGNIDAHAGLTDCLRLAGRPAEAVTAARAALTRHSGHPALLANLGAALHALGRTDEALAAYGQALERAPGLPEVDNNIARLHHEAGRTAEALAHLRRAFAARPADAEIARSLGAVLLEVGEAEEAARVLREATAAEPQSIPGHLLLGSALVRLGRAAEAEAAFRDALRLDPARADTWFQAGTAFLGAGFRAQAVPCLRQLCRLAPDSARHWGLFAQSLVGVRFAAADDALRADLLAALAQPGAENTQLTGAVISVLRLDPAVAALCTAAGAPDAEDVVRSLLESGRLAGLAGDTLLHALLEACVVTDPELERGLSALRRAFLQDAADAGGALADPAWLPLLCALASQCFLNEYAFAETPAETAAADTLAASLAASLADPLANAPGPNPARLAVLAAYRPLHRWPGAGRLSGEGRPAAFARLLERQVTEPLEEERLKAGLPRLTPVRDDVSRTVRAQYEENPHPRWVHAGLLDAPLPVPAALRAMFPHAAVAPGPWWEAPEVLIAGCGTGRESVWAANHFKGARVLAVDLSLSSLAYAVRQSQRLGLAVEYGQADILELGVLGRRFDVVQSVGVLHHMDEPLAGWRVLAGLLRPHGVMKIGLYSERARQPVVAARRFIAERGYGDSAAEIRRFRRDVLDLPDGHPEKPQLKPLLDSLDFYSTSACRDLVFHVREHRHALPQIAVWLDELGLEFLGFQLDDPTVAPLYRARFPSDPTLTDLTLWDRFEAEFPHSFGGLYQFWVHQKP